MALKFNPEAKKQRTKEAFDSALAEIEQNLSEGTKTTHLWIDKEVAPDVRSMLNDEFEKQGLKDKFSWGVVKTGSNFRTGRTEYFTSETVGDQKHYKLCYRE